MICSLGNRIGDFQVIYSVGNRRFPANAPVPAETVTSAAFVNLHLSVFVPSPRGSGRSASARAKLVLDMPVHDWGADCRSTLRDNTLSAHVIVKLQPRLDPGLSQGMNYVRPPAWPGLGAAMATGLSTDCRRRRGGGRGGSLAHCRG